MSEYQSRRVPSTSRSDGTGLEGALEVERRVEERPGDRLLDARLGGERVARRRVAPDWRGAGPR